MNEPLRPGEVDLDGGAIDPPVADPVVVADDPPVVEAATEDPPAPVADPAPEPEKRKPTGAVGELMELRGATKELRERLQRFETDPTLQRLTPELRQAIAEGRIVVQPQRTSADAERERLTKLAGRLDLKREDGTPDLDAAARVGSIIRDEVQEVVKPYVEHSRAVAHMTLRDKANANIEAAVAAATQNGWDPDFVRGEFERAAAINPQTLTDPGIAMEIWDATVGKVHRLGKILGKPAAARAEPAPRAAAAPIAAEATGRRGAGSGPQMSAAMQRTYKDHGLDPAKSYSATKGGKIDLSQGFALED